MTGIQRALEIPAPIGKVWAWLLDVKNWDVLSDEFVGSKGRYHYETVPAPDASAEVSKGCEVRMLDSKQAEFLRWKVLECEPPRRLTQSTSMGGWLHGFNFQLSYGLESETEGFTKVQLDLFLVYTNSILEVLSLFLPVRYFYGRSLDKMLRKMRSSLGSCPP